MPRANFCWPTDTKYSTFQHRIDLSMLDLASLYVTFSDAIVESRPHINLSLAELAHAGRSIHLDPMVLRGSRLAGTGGAGYSGLCYSWCPA